MTNNFHRPHHKAIAAVLAALDGDLLRRHQCWFGGGTAIALRYGEYRESVDIDFLVADAAGYREMRGLLHNADSLTAICRSPLVLTREIRSDQYGIRTAIAMVDAIIKFEIVFEARIALEVPTAKDNVCGIASLAVVDLVASKVLANSDRWNDDGVYNRDVIDLAMMKPARPLLQAGLAKATGAYGTAAAQDLQQALQRLQQRSGWLERCMTALQVSVPRAVVWKQLSALQKQLGQMRL
ncbi:MAG TPA: nucleotidyl transferase AbiEii/AbiGii toxin family protein [Candidatus Acidoferrum sp.]|nr:nucleotidyl transferase AbiEii/AbiGii toxin family protein [Candidatus Acidoferrum sp.]